jgi:WD40 repeat protein
MTYSWQDKLIETEDKTATNAFSATQTKPASVISPQERQDAIVNAKLTVSSSGSMLNISPTASHLSTAFASLEIMGGPSPDFSPPVQQSWKSIFAKNIAAPSFAVAQPQPGTRFGTTTQLAYANNLIRTYQSTAWTEASTSKDTQDRILWLTTRIVDEFAASSVRTSTMLCEIVLLGPFLNEEYHRKLLDILITDLETTTLPEADLLQGCLQLVQSADAGYLLPDDLFRLLLILCTHLQDDHQQSLTSTYYLLMALSRLLDIMVEGKVQDPSHIVDYEPLFVVLDQLTKSTDFHLRCQSAYALQCLMHIPHDKIHREFVLRHTGNIATGLLGAASVCNLDVIGFLNGFKGATVSSLEVGSEVVCDAQAISETEDEALAIVKRGIFSGGRELWYPALREAQEHVWNGRLADFNHLVAEAPCRYDVEFQWGVCQLLGGIAVDPQWNTVTRQGAINFLAELYRDDTFRIPDEDVDSCILNTLRQVAGLPDVSISSHVETLLQDLEEDGNIGKQILYRYVLSGPLNFYPLAIRLPTPASSPLLDRVQAFSDIDYHLHRLRAQRLEEPENTLYIPPQGKPTFRSSDKDSFPLMEKVLEFLASPGQVLLLLGDSGAGKSTFNLELENTLWKAYTPNKPIPLHINLPTIDNPAKDLIEKQLRYHNFSEDQIRELKQHRHFIVICDGYDESRLTRNLYTTNQFNKPGQWKAKVLISCRSQYLGPDYRARFQPTVERYGHGTTTDRLQEVIIASFSKAQIELYVERYVQRMLLDAAAVGSDTPSWGVDDYMNKLVTIPNLIDLVSNPFLLTLALRALPTVVQSEQALSDIRLTRIGLYDNFTTQWLKRNKQRLEDSPMSDQARATFDELLDADFIRQGLDYQKDLTWAIFQHQNGHPVIEYLHHKEDQTWKAAFFAPTTQAAMLRESSPLTRRPLARSGHQYRFLHRSLLEYLYSRVISDPLDPDPLNPDQQPTEDGHSTEGNARAPFVDHPLNHRSVVGEPSILQFLAERVETNVLFKTWLLDAIQESKCDAEVSRAAANAITILVRAGARFNGEDLRGIRIPGADLRGGEFDSANFEGADLSNTNLGKAWLQQANLSKCLMSGVQFGELSCLKLDYPVLRCVFSADGDILAVSTEDDKIHIYETGTWTNIAVYHGGRGAIAISPTTGDLAKACSDGTVEVCDISSGEPQLLLAGHNGTVTCIAYSPNGTLIATASNDATIRVWSTCYGDILHILTGHTQTIYGLVFSPDGVQLASCSEDRTVRTWNTETGKKLLWLDCGVDTYAVAYSPNGLQLAAGGAGACVPVWNAHSGEHLHDMMGHIGDVLGLDFSPDGLQIASCGQDGTIRLFDTLKGKLLNTLSGHLYDVTCAVFHPPNGDYIASGSKDNAVRLWKTGESWSDAFSDGQVQGIACIDISPNGKQIVVGKADGTIHFWETWAGKPRIVSTGHTSQVLKVKFSPCGGYAVSASLDRTARLWCTRTGESLQVFEGHASAVSDVAFSPCGQKIVSASEDKSISVWEVETGELQLFLMGHGDEVIGATFSPDGGQIASCSQDRTVRIWDGLSGEELFVLEHFEDIDQVFYIQDGHELISASISGSTLFSWNPQSGTSLDEPYESINPDVVCCSLSPSGGLIATGGEDGRLQLWDRSSDNWIEVLRSMIGLTYSIGWRQGFECIYLSTVGLGTLRVWKLEERKDGYTLQLLWGIGLKELSLVNANLEGIVGLDPVDFALMKQQGAIGTPQE